MYIRAHIHDLFIYIGYPGISRSLTIPWGFINKYPCTFVKQIKNKNMNFEVKNAKFERGWYTCENFNNIPTFWLVYEDKDEYANRINNSGLMLTLFNELPGNATINLHLTNKN